VDGLVRKDERASNAPSDTSTRDTTMQVPLTGDNPLRTAWTALHRIPGGRRAFSRMLGTLAPYSGTIGAEVLEVGHGFSRIRMRDRRAVRNHLDSIHALALANLGEMTSGVALIYSSPPNARVILERLDVRYVAKARGTLISTCSFDPPTTNERATFMIDVTIRDADEVVVTTAQVHWLLGPKRK